ncbi:MAG: DUF2793 domain-containing protein [Croceibacterium sp.]
MSDPIAFTSASPRHGLPLLFAGQAQKEFFVNEAHALIDTLLHPAIEGELAAPPTSPEAGQCWLVAPAASGDWTGKEDCLASFQAGTWVFAAPRDGMRLFDRATRQDMRYHGGWQRAIAPVTPSGGTTTDDEARTAIGQLIAALVAGGLLPAA